MQDDMNTKAAWYKCNTPGCSNDREHPAICCPQCLRELHGYSSDGGTHTVTHEDHVQPSVSVPETRLLGAPCGSPSSPTSIEQQALDSRISVLTERLELLEKAVTAHRDPGTPTISEEFKELEAFVAHATIEGFGYMGVEVRPQNAEIGAPRRCVIRTHSLSAFDHPIYARLGGLSIGAVPQLQFHDPNCRSYISTRWYDLQHGAPVNWAAVGHQLQHRAIFRLRNPYPFSIEVDIELWCDTKLYITSPIRTTASTPGVFYNIPVNGAPCIRKK